MTTGRPHGLLSLETLGFLMRDPYRRWRFVMRVSHIYHAAFLLFGCDVTVNHSVRIGDFLLGRNWFRAFRPIDPQWWSCIRHVSQQCHMGRWVSGRRQMSRVFPVNLFFYGVSNAQTPCVGGWNWWHRFRQRSITWRRLATTNRSTIVSTIDRGSLCLVWFFTSAVLYIAKVILRVLQ